MSVTIIEITEYLEATSITSSENVIQTEIQVEELGTRGVNGKSAYELAVEGGYTGTLEQFNESNTINDVDYNAYYILSKN